jgi:hypothetical protein
VDELAGHGLFRAPDGTRATLSWGPEHPHVGPTTRTGLRRWVVVPSPRPLISPLRGPCLTSQRRRASAGVSGIGYRDRYKKFQVRDLLLRSRPRPVTVSASCRNLLERDQLHRQPAPHLRSRGRKGPLTRNACCAQIASPDDAAVGL